MSAQFRPIGSIASASALLALVLGLGLPANNASAIDCLSAPNSTAPPNGHWYYRTDRTQDRKCWHLQADNARSEQGAAQTAHEEPAKASQSVAAGDPYTAAGFNDFMAQREGAKLSTEDVDNLYAEFLQWKRRTKN